VATSRNRFTEDERRGAVERARALMLDSGYSANKAAQAAGDDLGVTGRAVQRWAEDVGAPLGELSHDAAKSARARIAQVEYSQERRRALSDLLFTRVEDVAQNTVDAGELKDLALTFGILTDKRRLEEGKATERHENLDQRAILEQARHDLHSIRGGKAS
jgi:hypothetical protein